VSSFWRVETLVEDPAFASAVNLASRRAGEKRDVRPDLGYSGYSCRELHTFFSFFRHLAKPIFHVFQQTFAERDVLVAQRFKKLAGNEEENVGVVYIQRVEVLAHVKENREAGSSQRLSQLPQLGGLSGPAMAAKGDRTVTFRRALLNRLS
jgi:hypothetical protein